MKEILIPGYVLGGERAELIQVGGIYHLRSKSHFIGMGTTDRTRAVLQASRYGKVWHEMVEDDFNAEGLL